MVDDLVTRVFFSSLYNLIQFQFDFLLVAFVLFRHHNTHTHTFCSLVFAFGEGIFSSSVFFFVCVCVLRDFSFFLYIRFVCVQGVFFFLYLKERVMRAQFREVFRPYVIHFCSPALQRKRGESIFFFSTSCYFACCGENIFSHLGNKIRCW